MFPHGLWQIDNFRLLALRCRLNLPSPIRILQSYRLKIAGCAVFNLIWLGFAAGLHDYFPWPLHPFTRNDLPTDIIFIAADIILIRCARFGFSLKGGIVIIV